MLLPFDYNLLILVIEHAYMVCPGTFIVLFWKLKGTSVYWPWSKGIHSSKAKSPNWQWLPTSKTNFLGFVGSLGTKTIDFWFARAIPWPTRPIGYVSGGLGSRRVSIDRVGPTDQKWRVFTISTFYRPPTLSQRHSWFAYGVRRQNSYILSTRPPIEILRPLFSL